MSRQVIHRHSAYFWLMLWLWVFVAVGFAVLITGILTGTPVRFTLPDRII